MPMLLDNLTQTVLSGGLQPLFYVGYNFENVWVLIKTKRPIACCLLLLVSCLAYLLTLKIDTICFSETLGFLQNTVLFFTSVVLYFIYVIDYSFDRQKRSLFWLQNYHPDMFVYRREDSLSPSSHGCFTDVKLFPCTFLLYIQPLLA
jgi:hypothetical protein